MIVLFILLLPFCYLTEESNSDACEVVDEKYMHSISPYGISKEEEYLLFTSHVDKSVKKVKGVWGAAWYFDKNHVFFALTPYETYVIVDVKKHGSEFPKLKCDKICVDWVCEAVIFVEGYYGIIFKTKDQFRILFLDIEHKRYIDLLMDDYEEISVFDNRVFCRAKTEEFRILSPEYLLLNCSSLPISNCFNKNILRMDREFYDRLYVNAVIPTTIYISDFAVDRNCVVQSDERTLQIFTISGGTSCFHEF